MKHSLILLGLIIKLSLLAETPPLTHAAAVGGMEITAAFITALAEEARTNHPSLRAADERIAAARSQEKSLRQWENPMAEFGVVGAERRMREDDGDIVYGIRQKLPLFGQFQAEQGVAQAEIGVAQMAWSRDFQLLRKNIATNVFAIGYAESVVAIGREDLAWLEALLAVAGPRYEIGEASQVDLLRLQNERAKRITQIKTDESNLASARVNLNQRLNRDLHSPWPDFRLPPVAAEIVFSPGLVDLAVKNEPELKLHHGEIQVARQTVEKARRERWPEVSVGAELRQYSGSGELREGMVTFGFTLPWGNRAQYGAGIQRERKLMQAKEYDAAAHILNIRGEVFNLTVEIDAARREALLYQNEIIPRTEAVIKSAHIAWETGSGSLEDLLDAHRMLLEGQLMLAKSVAEQYRLLSELVLCCGLGDLEALEMLRGQLGGETPQTK